MNEKAASILRNGVKRMIEEKTKEKYSDYKEVIPTPEDLKLLAEIRKYPNLHKTLTQQPEYLVEKVYKLLLAIYS
jgi:hypothetical protein